MKPQNMSLRVTVKTTDAAVDIKVAKQVTLFLRLISCSMYFF